MTISGFIRDSLASFPEAMKGFDSNWLLSDWTQKVAGIGLEK